MKYLALIFTIMTFSCTQVKMDQKHYIYFVNSSTQAVASYLKIEIAWAHNIPDTTLPKTRELFENILPNSREKVFETTKKLRDLSEDLSGKTLVVTVFNMDTLNTYSWDTIVKYRKYERQIRLTTADLPEEGHFTLLYTP